MDRDTLGPTPTEIRAAYRKFQELDEHGLRALSESMRLLLGCVESLKENQRQIIYTHELELAERKGANKMLAVAAGVGLAGAGELLGIYDILFQLLG